MLMIGQWILLAIVVFIGLILLWYAAKYLAKLVIVITVTILIIYGLYQFKLLPTGAQEYIDGLISQERFQKIKDRVLQWRDWNREKIPQNDENLSS